MKKAKLYKFINCEDVLAEVNISADNRHWIVRFTRGDMDEWVEFANRDTALRNGAKALRQLADEMDLLAKSS